MIEQLLFGEIKIGVLRWGLSVYVIVRIIRLSSCWVINWLYQYIHLQEVVLLIDF